MKRNKDNRLQELRDKGVTVYSISRIDSINNCLHGAYRTYDLHEKGAPNIYSSAGSVTHDCLEKIMNNEATEADLLPCIQEELDNLDLLNIEFPKDRNGGDSIREGWIADMTHFASTYKKPTGNFKTEELFIYKTKGGHYLQGYIDLQRINKDGSIISTSFDKYCYTTVRHLPPFFDYHSEVAYSKIERVLSSEELEHPLVRNAMKYLDIRDIRLTYEADLPARSGLGTSSSFAVGMLNAFHRVKGKTADAKQLADEAIYVERVLCNEAGGWQDQIAAAFGGFNRIDFSDNSYRVTPVDISSERKKMLNDRLMLFFTGLSRLSAVVQQESKPISEKERKSRC